MNRRTLMLAGVVLLAWAGGGCKKTNSPAGATQEPITGRPTDPAVALRPLWNPTHRYLFRLEVTSSSQAPRRNAPEPVHQDTALGQDFSLAVTNLAEDGTRRIELEILTAQMQTSVGDQIVLNYDSESQVGNLADNGMIQRLEKIKGTRLSFKVSPENKITGSDGLRNLNDRAGNANGRGGGGRGGPNFGGAAAGRLIDLGTYRELIELSALPRQPVRIGETWIARKQINSGTGDTLPIEVTYRFKGWQKRDGRSCARLDFSGTLQPPSERERGNRGGGRGGGGGGGGGPAVEGGSLNGSIWFDPESALPVELNSDQSITLKGTQGGRAPRRPGGTNAPPAPQPTSTWTAVSKQQTTVKLLEAAPLGN